MATSYKKASAASSIERGQPINATHAYIRKDDTTSGRMVLTENGAEAGLALGVAAEVCLKAP